MNQPIKLIHLTCEFLKNPVIDILSPRLSWQIAGDVSNIIQSAYQIITAENENDILNGNGSFWDSGKIKSNQSNLIKYSGPVLKTAQRT